MMDFAARKQALIDLGQLLASEYGQGEMRKHFPLAYRQNGWFRAEDSQKALDALINNYLAEEELNAFLANYQPEDYPISKRLGLVLAGNIPMVGIKDILLCFLAGHKALIKYSSKDAVLIPALLALWKQQQPAIAPYFEVVEQLKNFDAVIATGSDNSARYFEHYFSKKPHIIRKNRKSVAVLSGEESEEDILALGRDIFDYFGLGCRSVAKVYLPKDFNFELFMQRLEAFTPLEHHSKYRNNYDYNRSLYLLNGQEHYVNAVLALLPLPALESRIASLHYEVYKDLEELEQLLAKDWDKIQVVVNQRVKLARPSVKFGQAQQPKWSNFADGKDTLAFLLDL